MHTYFFCFSYIILSFLTTFGFASCLLFMLNWWFCSRFIYHMEKRAIYGPSITNEKRFDSSVIQILRDNVLPSFITDQKSCIPFSFDSSVSVSKNVKFNLKYKKVQLLSQFHYKTDKIKTQWEYNDYLRRQGILLFE